MTGMNTNRHGTTIKNKLVAAAVITLGATAVIAAPAQATTVTDCQGEIALLRTATLDASLAPKIETGLVGKADAAADKLDLGKFGDALQKLQDYDATLAALHDAPKPKVDEDDYDLLNGTVDAAIACVAGIGTD